MKTLIKILFVALMTYVPFTVSAQQPGALGIETIYGEVTIGALNPWGNIHFIADEGTQRFYFNKPVWTSGGEIGSYQSDLKLRTHITTRMTILQSNGNVGIGTETPQARLDVAGNVRIGDVTMPTGYKLYVEDGILTERVRVASKDDPIEWADYVFESDYDLNSTEEVKTFIQQNKHLPNVPSAKEVAEKGVDIVEMDATLLRQIEELWLHTIQLNERIQELEEQLGVPTNK